MDQLDPEAECFVGWNNRWVSPLAVSKVRGNYQFNHSSLADELESFTPAEECLFHDERGTRADFIGAVKDGLILEPSPVMDEYLALRRGA